MIFSFLYRLFAFLIPSASAALGGYQLACYDIPGGCAPENFLVKIAGVIGSLLVDVAAGGTVLFVVIGGAQMLLSGGDDSKGAKGKNSIIYAIIGFIITVSAQGILDFVRNAAGDVADADNPFLAAEAAAVEAMLTVFNIIFVGVAFYAGLKLIMARGKTDEYTKGINMLIWAIIGAIVINLAYSIVSSISSLGF